MEKLKDAEILARLIYRAYIAPDPHAPLEEEALLPFTAALELYAKTWAKENREKETYEMLRRMAAEAGLPNLLPPEEETAPEPAVPNSDIEPEPAPEPPDTHTHTQPGQMKAESWRPGSSPAMARARSERSMRG